MALNVMEKSTSQTCASCEAVCAVDDLYCYRCGCILPHAMGQSVDTHLLGRTQTRQVDLQWGTGYFHHRARLFLRVGEGPHAEMTIPVVFQTQGVVIGRSVGNEIVNVDLTPYGAQDLGVSRRHARIERVHDTLHVRDLESANGTFLNRTRIMPNTPHVLRNRAVLQLGKLILRVQFA
jgi:hypothetical protein